TALVFSGGWSADFSARDVTTHATLLSSFAGSAGSGEVVDVTVDGFTVVKFQASAPGGTLTGAVVNCRLSGGRVRFSGIEVDSAGSLNLSVSDTIVERYKPGVQVFSYSSGSAMVVLSHVTLSRNRAGRGSSSGLSGVSVDTSTLSLIVNDSLITRNAQGMA